MAKAHNKTDDVSVGRFVSLILRHAPERIGATLDAAGWLDVDRLIAGAQAAGLPLDRAQLERIVAENDKKRFAFDATGARIRAVQGHSVAVDLGLEAATPPARLHHGTHPGALAAIRREGLRPMSRQHVHLSADAATATRVGARRGAAIVLDVDSGAMAAAGYAFFRSENGVWLTAAVPPNFIRFPDAPAD